VHEVAPQPQSLDRRGARQVRLCPVGTEQQPARLPCQGIEDQRIAQGVIQRQGDPFLDRLAVLADRQLLA
jgi:hypothetical protein